MRSSSLHARVNLSAVSLRQLGLAVTVGLLAVLVSSECLSAAPLLSVDFDQNDPSINTAGNLLTQSGFTSVSGAVALSGSAPLTAATQAIGSYTVNVIFPVLDGNDQGFFARPALTNAGSFTYANLYTDFVYTNGAAALNPTIQFSVSGVTPGKEYALTFYSYDSVLNSASSETSTFTPIDNTTGGTGTVTYHQGDVPTSNSEFSTTIYVSSTTNTLDILASASAQVASDDGLRVNGFTLSDVPEPGSLAALAGLGAMGLIALAKRRCS